MKNKENKFNQILFIIIIIFLSLFTVVACSKFRQKNGSQSGSPNESPCVSSSDGKHPDMMETSSGSGLLFSSSPRNTMANPAAVKCINDGYLLEPIVENGVPKGYMCVNPRTGEKCKIWDYFRKKCSLNLSKEKLK